ncbi:tRNA (adenosine(37)-N6)-threonylcarbamoyltransferase complex transferase subunit TsaD [archaeon]|nr:tRNA (adenosine(37)-N6)-threonylcarbamoyltransferase complex transferase subunit TsaD [archaeon]
MTTTNSMIILGIESTAHTFGVGVVSASNDNCEVLANVYDRYSNKEHGMVPEEIVAHHHECKEQVLNDALSAAKVTWKQIDAISYSAGPGIDPILWVGQKYAKALAEEHQKPLIPVNHCAAHLSIGKIINNAKDPCYLYVSGVNTQVIVQEDNKYRILGETLDNGMGNMLDKLGRILGLGFPAGPGIEKLAKGGEFIELPYSVKGMDISFSGLLTKCQQLWERKPEWGKLYPNKMIIFDKKFDDKTVPSNQKLWRKQEHIRKEDICYSLQETAFAAATEIAERAMAGCNKNELILVGGVGANKRFCEMLNTMCKERNATFYNVPIDLAGDQGAMIAWEGFLRKDNHPEMEVNCKWRTDEV